MTTAVITGATGMIGRHLTAELVACGYEVVLLVRPDSEKGQDLLAGQGYIPCSDNPDSHEASSCPAYRVVPCGMDGYGQLMQLGAQERPEALRDGADLFFHLAWGSTFGEARNDCAAQERNIRFALDAVELAAALGCSTFIGAGSQAEYGRVEGALAPDTSAHPENGYGMAKLAAGQLTRLRCSQLGLRHEWVRILSVYGPFDGAQTMVTSTCRALLEGRVPELTPAEQLWDYLYAGDAAKALRLVAEKGKDGAVYCLGSGQVRPLREYVETIRDCIDPAAELGFGMRAYGPNQVMHLVADITALREDTGFEPTVPFDEGILATVAWLQDEKKA